MRKFCVKYVTRLVAGILLSVIAAVPQTDFHHGNLHSIPAGSFLMGSSKDGANDEQPQHTVELDAFSITTHEITEEAYEACVAAGQCTPAHYDDSTCRAWNGRTFIRVRVPSAFRNSRFPVVCITWTQAQEYCRTHNMMLPTEAQWEYAARAGTTTRYPWGDGPPSEGRCIIRKKNGPRDVGSCSPNGWGLYDMIGNAWEWVHDYYDPEEYRVDHQKNPPGPQAGIYRVIRGGGWYGRPENATVTNRQWFSPDYGEVSIGFRCVKK